MPKVSFEEVVQFHGHMCPGLAIGYRMALAGLAALKEMRAEDEELVAIVENDACGVDALQVLTGCTFGKGNLIFNDYGKSVYTLFSRKTGQGVRIAYRGDTIPENIGDDRKAKINWILIAPEDALLSLQAVTIDEPPEARIHDSARCDDCGERVMVTRIRKSGKRRLCISCWEQEHGDRTPCAPRSQ
ncbi:TraR/DksA C4-type zinc finger protein [Candidatus Bipolaricaulota bacterium]|nr:TraR/DksA C4-type zinc finger protein [Candidatus Bipolaricaulota bacterium]